MIRNEIERIGLAGRVSFAGFRENVESVYAASDVVVQPSLEPDAFPTVILEAMASGCVVIASDSGGAREVLVDGKNGFLIPPGNSNALSRGVVELKQRNLSGIRLAARSTIEKHFNEESYVEKMTKWIEETGSGAMIARDSAQ
jgi:glycosyltransferase involved in cell wall biosynthesis